MSSTKSVQSRIRAALAVALSALTAACTVGPNFTPPAPPAVTTYSQPTDTVNEGQVRAEIGAKVVADWWTLFKSPALDALIRQAVAGNPTLEESRQRLKAAHEEVIADTGKLTADLNAGAQYERANLNAFSGGAFSSFSIPGFPTIPTNPQFSIYSLGASVSYNLDVFGGVRRKKESLQATEEADARELDATYLTLTGQVVEQALIIADANVTTEELNDIVAADQSDLSMVRKAYAAGGASKADVAAIESELARDQSAIPPQKQRLDAARHAMAILCGKAPADFTAPPFDSSSGSLPTTLPIAVPSDLVHNRPDILEAEAKLHAATAQIGVATANMYPNINLTGTLTQDALTPGQLFSPISTSFAVGAGLSQPLFHSGELKAKKRQAEDDARAALAAYEYTVLQAFGQVADALSSLANDNKGFSDQAQALTAASSRVDMMRKGYAAGGVSAYQLLDAERTWRRTRLSLSQQGFSRYADAAILLMAMANVPPGAAMGQTTP